MKVLAICQAGTVRSGAIVLEAKLRGHDALQAGVLYTKPRTVAMLSRWANVIFVAEAAMAAIVPTKYQDKVRDAALGPDRWHTPVHPELRDLARAVLERFGL